MFPFFGKQFLVFCFCVHKYTSVLDVQSHMFGGQFVHILHDILFFLIKQSQPYWMCRIHWFIPVYTHIGLFEFLHEARFNIAQCDCLLSSLHPFKFCKFFVLFVFFKVFIFLINWYKVFRVVHWVLALLQAVPICLYALFLGNSRLLFCHNLQFPLCFLHFFVSEILAFVSSPGIVFFLQGNPYRQFSFVLATICIYA